MQVALTSRTEDRPCGQDESGDQGRGFAGRWEIRNRIGEDATAMSGPASGNLQPLTRRVLAVRGIVSDREASAFLEPSMRDMHDPSSIPDMDLGAERILRAARDGDPIVIYGDYDVDGITATAILHHALSAIAPRADIRHYVPHRLDEGYGLNCEAIRSLAADGARVIVSVDCGITGVEAAGTARQCGVDLIITDHHNPPASEADMPEAMAVIHPRAPGSSYPFEHLPGAGVAFKLAWRLATMHCGSDRVTDSLRATLLELLSLAALGVIADVVPLVGENRSIARFGLAKLKHSKLHGVRALIEASKLQGESIDADAVGFRLAPRLNAIGRLGHASEAVEMLTTASRARAAEIAQTLCKLNDERRATERAIAEQAAQMAEEAGMTSESRRAIVLAHEAWHPGVVGIVCSRLTERFHRPAILLQRSGGVCSGSGRSVEGVNLHGALHACREHLLTFGGHDMAAGLKLAEPALPGFTEQLIETVNRELSPADLSPKLRIDCDATLAELTPGAAAQLEQLAPFGPGNPRVSLRIGVDEPLVIDGRPSPLGSTGKHFAMFVRQGADGARRSVMRLVAWRKSAWLDEIPPGARIEVVVCPKLNTWNGRASVEPELLDLRVVRA